MKTQVEFEKDVYSKHPSLFVGKYNGCHKKVTLECKDCGYKWEQEAISVVKGKGCPICNKTLNKLIIGINDMWTTNHQMANMLVDKNDGYFNTENSHKKLKFKCPICGEISEHTPANIKHFGFSCKFCSDGISYPNKYMTSLLKQMSTYIEEWDSEVVYDWCKYYINNKHMTGRYDFYFKINNQKYLIELDGKLGHGVEQIGRITKEEALMIDKAKDLLAVKNGYKIIRIDCKYKDMSMRNEYMYNHILSSKLNDLFDLSKVDFNLCAETAMSSYSYTSVMLWEKYRNVDAIAKIMKLNKNTIISYLKSFEKLGKTSFSFKNEKAKNLSNIGKLRIKKVICIDNMTLYNSITDASNRNKLDASSISKCCRNKIKTCGGFRWMYYDDFIINHITEVKEE